MKNLIFILVLLISFEGITQSNCDSLIINCCDNTLISNDTISVTAQNQAQFEIFDYPGFRLLDGSLTIVAEETVNYFGIGASDQIHYLNVLQSMSFPFTGTLQLWGGFYDTLYCEFPVIIEINEIGELNYSMNVFPNPATDILFIEGAEGTIFSIFTFDGKFITTKELNQNSIDISGLEKGGYILQSHAEQSTSILFLKL